MVYDVYDVYSDCYYFWQIENVDNTVLDKHIYRNEHINNAIYVFAIFGVLKSFFIIWLFHSAITTLGNVVDELEQCNSLEKKRVLSITKERYTYLEGPNFLAVVIIFEGGIEFYLELTYVDNYITKTDTFIIQCNCFCNFWTRSLWFMLARNLWTNQTMLGHQIVMETVRLVTISPWSHLVLLGLRILLVS